MLKNNNTTFFFNFSENLRMAEPAKNVEDLEDGEIESDDGETVDTHNEEKKDYECLVGQEISQQEDTEVTFHAKSGKKKKSKNRKGEQKQKKKNKKFLNTAEEDFAAGIEKAIRKAMNKNEDDEIYHEEAEEGRKGKKRKKYDGKESSSKKRKKKEYSDEMDETEMMCVRGASPVQRNSPADSYQDDDKDSYASDSSQESREPQQHQRPQRHRPAQRDRKNNNNKNDRDRRRGGAHPMQDPDGVCLYFMQGKCHKGDDCMYSHDAQPPRKMELCKFYLMECCAKRDKCLYMHADFPCKYYHTGLPCIYKDECKFAHGPPLNDSLKNILLKHIESAPKEILGDFPRLNREGAMKMIQNTQLKLMHQFSELPDDQDRGIPSLFDVNVQRPHHSGDMPMMNQYNNEKNNKVSPKVRQSRWQNDNSSPNNYGSNMSPPYNNTSSPNVLCIKNLTGVLTPRQISDLTKMGIENLDQLGQLTVIQLNSIGISLKQITEIQLNTMSIQKLGLINTTNSDQVQHTFIPPVSGTKDLDLRIPPAVAVTNSSAIATELPEKDIDMRFQPAIAVPKIVRTNQTIREVKPPNKDTIDIDQYTKDALKFASKDKENISMSNEKFESEKISGDTLPLETKDVDHRVLPFSEEDTRLVRTPLDAPGVKESDTDIRFLRPDPIFKSPEKRNRRSTTDDDDENNLCIDEKWYSSDEEKGKEKNTPVQSPLMSPPQTPAPHVIEPAAVLKKIGDLSKIDISEEVTKLLNTMKNNLQEPHIDVNKEEVEEPSRSRDPRARRSPEPKLEVSNPSNKKPRISIYECIDGEPTDGRRRSDVDLRQTDFKLPSFGDTDLRQGSSGDIDFRLGLPFKPLPNYTPASEIDGSINSHPPIPYKLELIDIPRPDYTDIRNSTAKSQALVDPRLRKVFRLSLDDSNSDSEKTAKPTNTGPRVDPRRKPKESETIVQDQKIPSLDLQVVIQNSDWYKELSSTHKIFVNQQIATVTAMIKMFQQDKTPGKQFDIASIQTNSVLVGIFTNLGVSLGENGEFSHLPKAKEGLLKPPLAYNQTTNPFGLNSNMQPMDNMMNMTNMNINVPMNNMAMGNMPGYNQAFPDIRGGPAPGLLGIAPNIPHNFNNKFPGPGNFGNMPFNNPSNDFGSMDGDQNYHRFANRGGHRGRGNERWNRGGNGRGHRDRKNFNDRGSWKSDRQ